MRFERVGQPVLNRHRMGCRDGGEKLPLRPYAVGSAVSPLTEWLKGGHGKVALPLADWQALAAWIDCNAPYYGSYDDIVYTPGERAGGGPGSGGHAAQDPQWIAETAGAHRAQRLRSLRMWHPGWRFARRLHSASAGPALASWCLRPCCYREERR